MDFKEETNGYAAFRLTGIVLGMDSHMPQGVILSEGSYIAVDTNVTRDYSSGYEFDKYGGVAITVRESSLRDSTGLLQATGETAESIGRARENYALMIERARLERE